MTGLAGAGTMIVELAAVRLLAPWFGASSAVWTNVIGIVLLALSVGYLVGARLALSPQPVTRLSLVLAIAGLFTAWLPWLAAPVSELFVPRGVALAESPELFHWGSLAAGCLLFAPPACVLACVGPLATEMLQRGGIAHAGAAGGRVLFASTLGSLAGTFATTYWLVPRFGSSLTFLGAGSLLILLSLYVRMRGRLSWAALLLAAPALALSSRAEPAPSDDLRVLAEGESSYQFVRVVEAADASYRLLQVNEGLDSFQSVWIPEPGLLGTGYYYDYFVLPLWWNESDAARVCVVGMGAGTAWRVLDGARPSDASLEMIGVEIDPLVVEYGHEFFELPRSEPRLTLLAGWDGRAALEALEGPCDLVVLDAYANQSEIPAHLSSFEFFVEVRERLAEGGMLAINVGGFGFEDPVVEAVASTVATAFGQRVLAVRVPSSRNVVLYARAGSAPPRIDEDLESAPAPVRALLEAVRLPGCWREFEPTDAPLTDDRNPIDRLQAQSLERGLEEILAR